MTQSDYRAFLDKVSTVVGSVDDLDRDKVIGTIVGSFIIESGVVEIVPDPDPDNADELVELLMVASRRHKPGPHYDEEDERGGAFILAGELDALGVRAPEFLRKNK